MKFTYMEKPQITYSEKYVRKRESLNLIYVKFPHTKNEQTSSNNQCTFDNIGFKIWTLETHIRLSTEL